MTVTHSFTKRKFLGLPLEQQHKKCAEVLRMAFEEVMAGNASSNLSHYNEMAEWLTLTPCTASDVKAIADRYHMHLQLASIQFKEHNLLPDIRQGDRSSGEPIWPIAIYLDHVRSAHNVGSIIRTVEAFSLGRIYFSEQTPFYTHKQVKDASMGTSEWVECIQGVQLESLPRPIIALETCQDAISLYEFVFPESFTLAVGNEEYGCSEHTLKNADYIVEIPLRGRKNSLNVANAFAIAVSEISKQRTKNFIINKKNV